MFQTHKLLHRSHLQLYQNKTLLLYLQSCSTLTLRTYNILNYYFIITHSNSQHLQSSSTHNTSYNSFNEPSPCLKYTSILLNYTSNTQLHTILHFLQYKTTEHKLLFKHRHHSSYTSLVTLHDSLLTSHIEVKNIYLKLDNGVKINY